MKAIVISALLFFSLRAMSAQVSEDKKGECSASTQSNRVVAPKIAAVAGAPVIQIENEGKVIGK